MGRLSTLGQLRLEGSTFRQAKPLLLLAYLALEGQQPRRRLAELLWPEGNRMKSLSMALTRIRQAAPGSCAADATHAWCLVDCDALDLKRSVAAEDWEAGQAAYRGAFLDSVELRGVSVELEDWVHETRENIADGLRAVLLAEAQRRAARGKVVEAGELVASAAVLAGARPAEPAQARRIYGLLSAARHPLAPEVRARLQDDLREFDSTLVEPRHERQVPSAVPASSTSFVGRERELALLAGQLEGSPIRLVTILGSGGSGKTRLAFEACRAAELWGSFPDGVHVALLDSVDDQEQLPWLLCRTLGAGTSSLRDGWLQLANVIGKRKMLLVLDNFEQLRAAAPRLSEVLRRAGELKILVTTRERLGLAEEHVLDIFGLPHDESPQSGVPATESPAFQLLCQRALAAKADFAIESQAGDLAQICRLLEGLPLGLELAAGMLRFMPAAELAALIESDPTALESSGSSSIRHSSLRAVAAASWRLLPTGQQRGLARLAVFVGGFRRQAAEAVASVRIRELSELLDRSWLKVDSHGRFGCHPFLNAFLRERLADEPADEFATMTAHAGWYSEFAHAAARRLRGPEQDEAIAALAVEHANLIGALEHLVRHDARAGLALAVDLGHYWSVRGHYEEGSSQLKRCLELAGGDDLLSAAAWNILGHLASRTSDHKAARAYFERGLKLAEAAGDHALQGDALLGLGSTSHLGHADYASARERYQASLWHAGQCDDKLASCDALRYLGALNTDQANYLQAKACYEEALSLADAAGDAHSAAKVATNLATVLTYLGERARAHLLNSRSLEQMRAVGDKYGEAVLLINLAVEASDAGDLANSRALNYESLTLFRQLGDRSSMSQVLNNLASSYLKTREPHQAQALLEESLDYLRTAGDIGLATHAQYLYAAALLDMEDRPGAKRRLDECIELCRGNDENWALMRALVVLARWHAGGGEIAEAWQAVEEADRLARAAGDQGTLRQVAEARVALDRLPAA